MEANALCFEAEWYDSNSDLTRAYFLNYYSDNTLELVDKKTGKMFLKRIFYESVSQSQLFIGAIVTIYSRQFNITAYANEYTKSTISKAAGSKIALVIHPSGYNIMGKIITAIEKSDYQIINAKMIRITNRDISAITEKCIDGVPSRTNNISEIERELTSDVSVALEIVKSKNDSDPSDTFQSLKDRDLAPFTSHISFFRDPEYFFTEFRTTAQVDNNSTTCIIRPRLLSEKNVGTVLSEILNAGFEISALELFRLTTDTAEEFFDVYKGVVEQYNEMLSYMSSAPVIALEIRAEDAVNSFREFVGPFDIEVAKTLRPDSLRARYGKSNVQSAVHCTDCPEDGPLESQYFFRKLQI